jgi:hypothetical protein
MVRACGFAVFREGRGMFRSVSVGLLLAICGVLPVSGQGDPASLEGYFTGKTVVVKVDMPGTEKGVDLDFEKAAPLDWKPYSSRLSDFGIAIHKGDAARITKIALKSDHIEFQLNGGGYGTFGDSTSTEVKPKDVDKSKYEKDLEKQVKDTKNPKEKQDLQTQLDKEVEKRERQEQANKQEAAAATQVKVQELAEKRANGGSRFNLNFKKTVPPDDRNPDAVMKLLAEYVDFDASVAPPTGPVETAAPDTARPAYVPAASVPSNGSGSPAQLKRGMAASDVSALLGNGQQISQSVSSDGLKTQVIEYTTADNVVDVTFVEGVVVKYTINSR